MKLTSGAVLNAFNGTIEQDPTMAQPVLQVHSFKKMQTNTDSGTQDRYRVILSDGDHLIQSMFTTQLNELFTSEQLTKCGIIRLKKFIVNSVQGKRVLIVLECEVLTPFQSDIPRIGDPTLLGNEEAKPKASPTVAQPTTTTFQPPTTTSNNSDEPLVQPIESLSPYNQKYDTINPRWTICARVVAKSQVREWNKGTSSGKLFSVTFADESGEIRATGFNEQLTMFYNVLQENQVYYVSGAYIKPAQRQYSNVKNEYEMTFSKETSITPCTNSAAAPQLKYNRVLIGSLGSVEKDTTVDIIGVVANAGQVTQIVTKTTNKQLSKRELMVADESGYQVQLTLWGQQAEQFDGSDEPVIAAKGCRVGDYKGRSLSLLSSGSLQLNPDVKEAHLAKGWYTNAIKSGTSLNGFTSENTAGTKRSDLKAIADIKNQGLGLGDKPDYFSIRGAIVYMKKENNMYPACPSEGCAKKVTQESSGWRCEKCSTSWPQPLYRYILTLAISDHTGQHYLQSFNDTSEQLLGKTANELNALEEAEPGYTEQLYKSIYFTEATFRVRAKQEVYQNEQKVRVGVMGYQPVDYAQASAELSALIEQYN